jgi:hypothetical protein
MTLVDCTITGNDGSEMGCGIFSFNAPVTLVRTICRGNGGGESPAEISVGTRVLTLNCSDVDMSGVEAQQIIQQNVIDADPLFCDPRPCYQGARPVTTHCDPTRRACPVETPAVSSSGRSARGVANCRPRALAVWRSVPV